MEPSSGLDILHVIHGLTLGGAEVDAVQKAIALVERYGYDVTVCCLMRRGALASRAEAAGIRVVGPLMRHRYDVLAARPLRRLLRGEAWSVVHTHLLAANFVTAAVWLTLPLAQRPLLLFAEHAMAERWPRTAWWLYRWMQRRVAAILVPTQVAASSYAARGIARETLIVLPNGLDVARFEEADRAQARRAIRRSLRVPDDAYVVGTVARLQKVKGLAGLVSAVADLPVHLIVIGDGPERAALAGQVEALGLKDRVYLVGARTDIPHLLAAFDLFVLPSLSESFGISVAEALLADTPVIATEVGGVPEITAGGKHAFLVPPGDTLALERAIRWAIDHGEEARAKARAGHAFIARNYALDTVVEEQHALYRRVLEQRSFTDAG